MKTETVAEYLARGGQVEVLKAIKPEFKQSVTMSPKSTMTIMDLDEGAHFFSEIKPSKPRKKKAKALNVSALPESLLKFVL